MTTGIAAADRVGRITRHRPRFENKNVAFDQRQIEMLRVSRTGMHVAFDFARDLRSVLADAAAMQQHTLRDESRFAHELLVEGDHLSI